MEKSACYVKIQRFKFVRVKKGPCALSRFGPRPSFLTGVVGHSQPSVGREGTITRVRWLVSKNPMSTKPICLTFVSLPFDFKKNGFSGHGPVYVR